MPSDQRERGKPMETYGNHPYRFIQPYTHPKPPKSTQNRGIWGFSMAYRGIPVFKGGYIDFYREHKKYAIGNIFWGYGGHTPLLTEAGKNNIAYLLIKQTRATCQRKNHYLKL